MIYDKKKKKCKRIIPNKFFFKKITEFKKRYK